MAPVATWTVGLNEVRMIIGLRGVLLLLGKAQAEKNIGEFEISKDSYGKSWKMNDGAKKQAKMNLEQQESQIQLHHGSITKCPKTEENMLLS